MMNIAQRNVFNHAERVSEEKLGASITQMAAVMLIHNSPGCMQKDIVKGLGLKKSAVASLLARIESNGLIKRIVSDEDARVVQLYTTPLGSEKAEQSLPLIDGLNNQLTEDFNDAEIEVIARFLNQAIERF